MKHIALLLLSIWTTCASAVEAPVPSQDTDSARMQSNEARDPAQPAGALQAAGHAPDAAAATVQEGCRPLTFKAMAADVKAFTARSQKLELTEQAQYFKDAVTLWTQAGAQCEGHAKEQAQRNLAESLKELTRIGDQLGAGAQCETTQKDASALQDMAKHALSERQWSYAAMLFHKAENMWDMAAEDCSGNEQAISRRHREEAAIDGHNAEFCAPLYAKAREKTLKLRAMAASLSVDEKRNASMVAETLWREAMSQCKGETVQDTARNNAQLLARERGTPWVSRVEVVTEPASVDYPQDAVPLKVPLQVKADIPVALVAVVGQGSIPMPGGASVHADSAQRPQPVKEAPAAAVTGSAEPAKIVPRSKESAPPLAAKQVEFIAENAAQLNVYSGIAKVRWANGDVFEGELLNGLRQGRGLFVWANGQSYSGDWSKDKPEGQGALKFANGNQYDGAVMNGVPQGQGRMRYISGDVYTGHFNAGEPEGEGVSVWKNGQRYEGVWKNGRANGQGRTVFASGDSYTGNYVDDLFEGVGTFDWVNGDKYVGQWKAGKMHGKGKFTWKNGSQWEGNYVNGAQSEQDKLPEPVQSASGIDP